MPGTNPPKTIPVVPEVYWKDPIIGPVEESCRTKYLYWFIPDSASEKVFQLALKAGPNDDEPIRATVKIGTAGAIGGVVSTLVTNETPSL